MSHDFRIGILPAGSLAVSKASIPSIPFPFTIDHTSADVYAALASTGTSHRFWAQGKGNIRAVPNSVVALVYASTWDFDVSLSGIGGSMTWAGTLKRGRFIQNGVETGTQLFTQRDAFSQGIYPPDPDPEFKDSSIFRIDSDTESETETFLQITFNPRSLVYVVADDTWIVNSLFSAFTYSNSTSDITSVASSGTGTETSGLTICGETWKLMGEDVGGFSGSITPATWLT
jgi:hypothetical protein